jgi:hypothetical protein
MGGFVNNLICDQEQNFTLTPIVGNNSNATGTLSFTVTPLSTGGDSGIGAAGDDSAEVLIAFTYSSTSSVPEPASLLLIGGGLIGLGVFARRKRRS